MYFVYILTNWDDSVLYIGVTSNLEKRLYEHRNHLADGFTKKYNIHKLVYFEESVDVNSAIAREKQLKGWTRKKKNQLIQKANPEWKDLSLNWDSCKNALRRFFDSLCSLRMTNFLVGKE